MKNDQKVRQRKKSNTTENGDNKIESIDTIKENNKNRKQ